MSDKYNALFDAGNAAQLEKLTANEHKTGWDDIEIEYAIGRLCREILELAHTDTHKEIRAEAADIANFAHMIILACDKQLKRSEERVKPVSRPEDIPNRFTTDGSWPGDAP